MVANQGSSNSCFSMNKSVPFKYLVKGFLVFLGILQGCLGFLLGSLGFLRIPKGLLEFLGLILLYLQLFSSLTEGSSVLFEIGATVSLDQLPCCRRHLLHFLAFFRFQPRSFKKLWSIGQFFAVSMKTNKKPYETTIFMLLLGGTYNKVWIVLWQRVAHST